ncbi:MAG TPA: response regulator [Methylomirabilota bacterium]
MLHLIAWTDCIDPNRRHGGEATVIIRDQRTAEPSSLVPDTGLARSDRRAIVGVVDDDASILRALRRLLQAAGFSVETFGSAGEVLSSSELGRIDCLVLDIHLGDLSGFDVHERLPDSRPIPIIFITAHDTALTRERARLAGAVDYLRKPFDEKALIGAIDRALART